MPSPKATIVIFWREEWGVFSDSCIGRHHIIDLDYYGEEMASVQPTVDIDPEQLDRKAGPENVFLALHVKRELFGLRDYMDGVKMVVGGAYKWVQLVITYLAKPLIEENKQHFELFVVIGK